MKTMKADFKKKTGGSGKKTVTKIITVVISIAALALCFIYLQNIDSAARNTVKIVRAKNEMPAYALISREDIEAYDIIKKEYDNAMILFENAESIYGKYTTTNIRKSTVLYQDQLMDERPLRNEWLYGLNSDEEVVTIPYNSTEAGGSILLPGDLIRVRVSYEVEETAPAVPDDENPNSYITPQKTNKKIKTDILFNSIVVKDMINTNGNSVYEIYKEVMRLDEKQRQDVMKSNDFISSIRPKALLLAGSPADMERYAQYKYSVSSGSFLITILSRTGNEIGLDRLPTLETEVRSWMEKGVGKN